VNSRASTAITSTTAISDGNMKPAHSFWLTMKTRQPPEKKTASIK
jgi:hypothetical protein